MRESDGPNRKSVVKYVRMAPQTEAWSAAQSVIQQLERKLQIGLEEIEPLKSGMSGASVFLVDSKSLSDSAPGPSGLLILKIAKMDPADSPEHERYRATVEHSTAFANSHIPKLLDYAVVGSSCALLFEVAGLSQSSIVTAPSLDSGALARHCGLLSSSLLRELNSHPNEEVDGKEIRVSTRQTLCELLGYRLDPKKAPTLHKFVDEQTEGRPTFPCGEILVNPVWFCGSDDLERYPGMIRFTGRLHRDLHPGNVLFSRESLKNFWIIDWALSTPGILGYDHAYFELALLLAHFGNLLEDDPARLFRVLEALTSGRGALPSSSEKVHPDDSGWLDCLGKLRAELSGWQKEFQPNRKDPFDAQQFASRVAAGINWGNKPIAKESRRVALLYAAWSAREYIKRFQPKLWRKLTSSAPPPEWRSRSAETNEFASVELKKVLAATQNLSAIGIDDGVFLYHLSGFAGSTKTTIIAKREASFSSVREMTMPVPRETLVSCVSAFRGDVRQYLDDRIDSQLSTSQSDRSPYRVKVGVSCIHPPITSRVVQEPLSLDVYPLSSWVEHQFNRPMILAAVNRCPPALLKLRDDFRKEILTPEDHQTKTMRWPSALFVEVAIVTEDRHLIVLKKSDFQGHLAKVGRCYSCSVEEGLEWDRDYIEGLVDFEKTALECLEDELGIVRGQVGEVKFFGVALEYTHLNTALVGVAKLTVTAEEFNPIFKSRIHRRVAEFEGYETIELNQAFDQLFGHPKYRPDEWHPTGRLRALLALYEHFGYSQTLLRHFKVQLSEPTRHSL